MNEYIHKVTYYECDRMGITHHSNYIRFMEEARVDFLDRIGYGFEVARDLMLAAGFTHYTTFKNRKPEFHPIPT